MSSNEKYTVGYAKPPKHSQFQKGKSGNPRGRPIARRTSFADNLSKILDKQKVTINTPKGPKKVTTGEALAMRVVQGALELKKTALDVVVKHQNELNKNFDPYLEQERIWSRERDEAEKAIVQIKVANSLWGYDESQEWKASQIEAGLLGKPPDGQEHDKDDAATAMPTNGVKEKE